MRTLDPLGLRIFRANGSIDSREREELFEALREGAWDIVLATPEFLDFHRDALARAQPALVRGRRRSASPARIAPPPRLCAPSPRRSLRSGTRRCSRSPRRPATKRSRASSRNCASRRGSIDPTVRENLHVIDARGVRDKIAYLIEVFGANAERPEKGIVYCNSRARGDARSRNAAPGVRQRGDVLSRRHAGAGALGDRAPLPRGRPAHRDRDVGLRRGHRFARRAARRALPSQLRFRRVQSAGGACRTRRRAGPDPPALRREGPLAQRVPHRRRRTAARRRCARSIAA